MAPVIVGLSAQAMINCDVGGDCNGGDAKKVFEYAHTNGIPDSSCENYESTNLNSSRTKCEDIDLCMDCHPPSPRPNEFLGENCKPIPYKKYYISDYYTLSGAEKMRAEIFAHGPISCGMYLSPNLIANYNGKTIYSEEVDNV